MAIQLLDKNLCDAAGIEDIYRNVFYKDVIALQWKQKQFKVSNTNALKTQTS